MSYTPHPPWSDEDSAKALELWAAGQSGTQIAIVMGRTRNAVIGRLYRLRGLRDYRREVSKPKRIAAPPKPPKPRKEPKPMPAPPPPPAPAPEPMGLDIMDLKRDSCRWIHPDGTYCGATTREGRSYCDHHHAVCYQPAPPRVDRAIRATALRSEKTAKVAGWWL